MEIRSRSGHQHLLFCKRLPYDYAIVSMSYGAIDRSNS